MTRLSAREDFTEFCHLTNLKTHTDNKCSKIRKICGFEIDLTKKRPLDSCPFFINSVTDVDMILTLKNETEKGNETSVLTPI
jgi:ligand-binding sensor protein